MTTAKIPKALARTVRRRCKKGCDPNFRYVHAFLTKKKCVQSPVNQPTNPLLLLP